MEDTKKCLYCGQEIKAIAKKCRNCGKWLTEQPETRSQQPTYPRSDYNLITKNEDKKKWKSYVLIAIIVFLILMLPTLVKLIKLMFK